MTEIEAINRTTRAVDDCAARYAEEIDRLRTQNADYKRFITRWVEIIQGGDKITRIEGWAQDFIHEANALEKD